MNLCNNESQITDDQIINSIGECNPPMSLFVVGYPSYVGGADTELWHTIKLWRRRGIGVNLIPTWHTPQDWRGRLEAIGANTIVWSR